MDRVLLIDDDTELCALLTEYLAPEGLQTEACHNGGDGLLRALSGDFDVALLDVTLPDMNGFDVLGSIRAQSSLPVIMLTGRADDVNRIVGLEMGADDYVPKPFVSRELLARVRSLLRRSRMNAASPYKRRSVTLGGILIDRSARIALRDGAPLPLTPVEFAILQMLVDAAGETVPRDDLSRTVLGRELLPFDRSLDVHVSNLRRKLGPTPDGLPRIVTVRSAGFFFRVPASTDSYQPLPCAQEAS